MGALLRFLAILQADLRERTRSRRFWVALALVGVGSWYCFPADDASYVVFSTNGARGLYSSAWVGLGMSLVLSFLLGLVGFYAVRGTLVRDFETRVWQLLVATPMTRAGFLLAKWASHMVVFLCIALLALGVALVAQTVRGEDRTVDVVELIKPVLLISLPCLALSAMAAIWFDLLPWLRRTLGNVIFFVAFLSLVATPLALLEEADPATLANQWHSDPAGMTLVARDLQRVRSAQLGHDAELGFNLGAPRAQAGVERFAWRQWNPRLEDSLGRLLWLVLAIGGVLAAAPLLDRAASRSTAARTQPSRARSRQLAWLSRLLAPLERDPFGTLVAAELKLALRPRHTGWWLALGALWIAQLANTGAHLQLAMSLAWLLPLDLLARLALRDVDTHTAALVFTAPRSLWRLLGARLVVGMVLAVGAVLPGCIRLLATSATGFAAAVLVSASLVGWGLALGLVFRNPRIYEIGVLGITYLALQGAGITDTLHNPQATLASHAVGLAVAGLLVAWRWPGVARR